LEQGYFKDQKITLETLPDDTNRVDMNIVTQDLMSWNIVDIIGIKSAAVGIELKNFLGLSQHWNNYISLNYRKDKLVEFSWRIRIPKHSIIAGFIKSRL
jgi:hypothetical protein